MHSNTCIPFRADGWLKRQNPTECMAHDALAAAPLDNGVPVSTLTRATVMAILPPDPYGLVIFSDLSALFISRIDEKTYSLKPDAVRLKKRLGKISLWTQNHNLHGAQKILRVQMSDGSSIAFDDLPVTHPFLTALRDEVDSLSREASFAPLITNWTDWSIDDIRCWQTPELPEERRETIRAEAAFLLRALGVSRQVSIQCPGLDKKGHITPFSTYSDHPEFQAFVHCLNDPVFSSPEQACLGQKFRKSLMVVKPNQSSQISNHRRLELSALATLHAPDKAMETL